jgi:hypothetical protein
MVKNRLKFKRAGVAELVDARDLKSLVPKERIGSSPISGTKEKILTHFFFPDFFSAKKINRVAAIITIPLPINAIAPKPIFVIVFP